MAKTAADLSENPGPTDDLVRHLETAVTPWMALVEQFIRELDEFVATGGIGAAPVELDKRISRRTRRHHTTTEGRPLAT